jgi:hypothetical protein
MRCAIPIALFALVAIPASAFAQSTSAPASPPAAAATSGAAKAASGAATPDRQICKTSVPAGTRFATKECHTKAEWDRMSSDAQQDLSNGAHPYAGGPK